MTTETIAGVSLTTKANVYFDGKCVSHTVLFADGSKKTVGVILPASLTFNTGAPEIMETVAGKATIKLAGCSSRTVATLKLPSSSKKTFIVARRSKREAIIPKAAAWLW